MLAFSPMTLCFIWLHFATDPQLRWAEYERLTAEMAAHEAGLGKATTDEETCWEAGV